jgi:hypothetical protein
MYYRISISSKNSSKPLPILLLSNEARLKTGTWPDLVLGVHRKNGGGGIRTGSIKDIQIGDRHMAQQLTLFRIRLAGGSLS